ncbi:hypothetical protein ABVT39_009245 [Epinephelus coioides]
MSLTAAARGFVVFLLSVSVIQGQKGWGVTYTSTEICAVKGSTVEIHCSYRYPSRINGLDTKVEKASWFIDVKDGVYVDLKTDPQYSGRVQYVCDEIKNDCTLRITDLRESDSAVYKFRFITNQPRGNFWGKPGVTLSVTDLDLKVSRSSSFSSLQCHSSRYLPDHTSYIWYKNGQKIKEGTSPYVDFSYDSADSYSCAVKGCGGFSPSVYAPKLPSVSVSPSAEIVEGSSVTLTCSSDANPAAKYTWYNEDGNLFRHSQRQNPQLVFSSIQSSDSGEYYCKAENELGRRTSEFISIDVKYAPKLPSVSVSPSAEIVEGSSVTLTCSSDANPAANYTWYKEDEDSPKASGQIFTITDIRAEHSGNYYCEAKNTRGRHNSTLHLTVVAGPVRDHSVMNIIRLTLVVLVLTLLLLLSLWTRKKKTLSFTTEAQKPVEIELDSCPVYENVSDAAAQTEDTEEQEDLMQLNQRRDSPDGNKVVPHGNISVESEAVEDWGSFSVTHSGFITLSAPSTRDERSSYESNCSSQRICRLPPLCVRAAVNSFLHLGALQLFLVFTLSSSLTTGSLVLVMIQGQNGWGVTYTSTEICAVKGSTVEIHCSYRYPSRINGLDTKVEKAFWFIEKKNVDLKDDPQYSGRVQYDCDEIETDCTLKITNLRESDSAVYKFRFITNQPGGRYTGEPGVTLSVRDLQVQVSRTEVYTSYIRAELKCHSSCHLPGPPLYIWYKNGQKMWGPKYLSLTDDIYDPASSYSCAVTGHENSSSPTVSMQGEKGWGVTYTSTEICAFKGSTVEIHCSYRYPSRINGHDTAAIKTFWFTKKTDIDFMDLKTDPQYSGRVYDHCNKNNCILRITNLRESDSAVYKFRFITNQGGKYYGEPGVTLSVTDPDLQVQVKSIVHQGYSKAELRCHSSCHLTDSLSYIWYKNGQKIKEYTSSISVSITLIDSYSCALKGHEDFPSSSVCVDGRYCNRVMYTHRNICASKGSSVDISCTYSSYKNHVESKFWFSPERKDQWQNPSQPEDLSKDSQFAGRVQVIDTERGRSTLRITDLRESDSAEYHFKFTAPSFEWRSSLPGTTLTVTDPDLQVQIRPHWFSSKNELNCRSRCRLPDRPSFIWYKNGQEVRKETFSSYSDYFGSVDSYSCAVKGHEDFPSPPVCVHGQTCNRVTYNSRSICALKGSSVDISCTYKSYEDDVESKLWFSHSQPGDITEDSQYAGRVQVLETKGGHSTLRITDLRESDSGQYRFKFKTPSFEWESSLAGTTLTVTALQVQVTRITVRQSVTEAELKCHSSCSPAGRLSYVWFKNGEKIIEEDSSSYKDQFYPGEFISCAFEGHGNYSSPSVYAPEVPSVSANPSAEIMEGTLVTLTCGSDANTAAKYTWYKENQTLITEKPQLVFSSIQSSDSGLYYCIAENQLGRRKSDYMFINVKYAPKTSSVSVSPSAEIVEGSSVTLTCSSDANPAANYTWYKENQKLLQGPEGSYRFTSISSEDRVYYHCKSENQYGQMNSSSLFIDVQYAPKLPSVSVSPSAEIVEGSSVTLTCSSDANPAANYTWYKEDEDSPKASGQIFTITNVTAEHSGNYYCEAQNTRGRHNSTSHLTVVAGAGKSTAVGTTTTFVLAVILLSVFILTRKKRAAKQSFRSGERSEYRTQQSCPQYLPPGRQLDDPQDDLHYASVRFCKNQADLAVSPVQPHRHETEESVVYADVTFKRL